MCNAEMVEKYIKIMHTPRLLCIAEFTAVIRLYRFSVGIVNRICDKHDFPRIYTGGEARREYGDFAIALVSEIFAKRN